MAKLNLGQDVRLAGGMPFWGAPIMLGALCLLFSLVDAEAALMYSRGAIGAGGWHRLLTGHLVHTNAWHLAMNMAGALAVAYAFPLKIIRALLAYGAMGVISGLLMYGLFPSVSWYMGLSGLLHGMVIFAALQRDAGWERYAVIAAVGGKVLFEMFAGGSAASSALIEAPVSVEGHACGLMAGVIAGMFWPGENGLHQAGQR